MDTPALDGRSRLARVLLGLIALAAVGLGLMATFTPRAFYDDFPSGRGWVAADGPYNEHLVRDFGAMNLALLVLTVVAMLRFTPFLARVTAAAWLTFDVPHLVHHLRHLDVYDTADAVANVVSLSSGVLIGVAVLVLLRGAGQRMPVSQRTSTSV